jgi:hypothetical protein
MFDGKSALAVYFFVHEIVPLILRKPVTSITLQVTQQHWLCDVAVMTIDGQLRPLSGRLRSGVLDGGHFQGPPLFGAVYWQ